MFEAIHTPPDVSPAPAAATAAQEPAIRINYLGGTDAGELRTRDSLDILLPTCKANLFATFRAVPGRDRTTFIRAPLLSIVPPGLPHLLADAPGTKTLILSIAAPFFTEMARKALEGADPILVEPHATADHLLREVGDAVERDVRCSRRLDGHYLESLAAVLAAHVARNYTTARGAKATPSGGLAPHQLNRVRSFVADHLGETIRVEQLAATVHLSPFHFARMFKQSTGQSPHQHILMQRIERARQLLAGTDLSLVDVTAEAGFGTQGHFTGVFHRYTGFTPRAFRLHARECARPAAVTGDRHEQ